MSETRIRTRLAPTPSGLLHRGNALNFLLAWLAARREGGKVLLRIDDIDGPRAKAEYVEDIFRSLEWLGLDWDEGPGGPDDFYRNWSQHLRAGDYQALLARLCALPGAVFACRLSRAEITALSHDGQYPLQGREQGLRLSDEESAWRILTPEEHTVQLYDRITGPAELHLYSEMRDFVIRRRDGLPAYQLASLSDDLRFGVNLIVRGQDLMLSSAAQLFLAKMLDEEAFTKNHFVHHPLLKDDAGAKLSKSSGAASLQFLRHEGGKPALIYAQAAALLGIQPAFSLELAALLDAFAWPGHWEG